MKPKASKRKTSPRKSGGERRKVERRKAPRRLRKTVSVPARRVKKNRRSAARRGGVRRSSDTYFGKIDEFKKQDVLPPLEEEVITEGLETVSGDEPPANEPEPDPADPAPESENN